MGLIELTRPADTTYVLTLNSPPDNRLTPTLLNELGGHLDTIEASWRKTGAVEASPKQRQGMSTKGGGAVIITSACKGFFSNGLDYEASLGDERFFPERPAVRLNTRLTGVDVFDPVIYRLMTFPLVTIAAINGHAFAGGFILSLACDFRLMTNGRGLMCMNEVLFGAPLPNSFGPLLSLRIPHPPALRDTLLARRWTQAEALKLGILDEVIDDKDEKLKSGETGKLMQRAMEVAQREGEKVGSGAWGPIKDRLYCEVIDASRSDRRIQFPKQQANWFWVRTGRDKPKAKL